MGIADDMGDALARDVIAALEELGDDRFYDRVAKILTDGSPTLQEAFMTSIRVRLAERRARSFLDQALKAKRSGGTGPIDPRNLGSGSS
jgi:hypothetical protein